MQIKVQVTELTHRDLKTLLSVATNDSNWLYIRTPKGAYSGTNLYDKNDEWSDMWAKVLLNGGKLFACDCSVEDATEHFDYLPHKFVTRDGCMRYEFTLEDVKRGIAKAFESGIYSRECAFALLQNGHTYSTFEADEADTLMQYIIFGGLVYD